MSKLLEQELFPQSKAQARCGYYSSQDFSRILQGSITVFIYITLPRHYLLQFALLFLGLVQSLENQLPLETSVAFH